jgi:hypothetical protein
MEPLIFRADPSRDPERLAQRPPPPAPSPDLADLSPDTLLYHRSERVPFMSLSAPIAPDLRRIVRRGKIARLIGSRSKSSDRPLDTLVVTTTIRP